MASLLRVWCAVNAHCKVDETDAVMEPMTAEDVDKISLLDGFGNAMIAVGWAVKGERNSLIFPNFLEFNDPVCLRNGPKSNAERQREFRQRKRTVTESNGSNDRLEKRREEKTPLPPEGEGGREEPKAFAEFMAVYPKQSNRPEALAQWLTLKPSAELASTIIAAVTTSQRLNPQWTREDGRYVPKPDKWLRDRGWEWKPTANESRPRTAEDVLRDRGIL